MTRYYTVVSHLSGSIHSHLNLNYESKTLNYNPEESDHDPLTIITHQIIYTIVPKVMSLNCFISCHVLTPNILGCPSAYGMHDANFNIFMLIYSHAYILI